MNSINTSGLKFIGSALLGSALLFSISACGNEPPAPLSSFSEFCKKENNNKRVALDGYVKPSGLMFCKRGCLTGFYERRMQEGRGSARVNLKVRGSNGMERLKKRYRRGDFTLYDKDGKPIKFGTAARIHGKVKYSNYGKEGPSCYIQVDLIEKTAYKEKLPKAVPLSFGNFCADKYDNAYVVMTAMVGLPSSLFCRGGCGLKLNAPGQAGDSGVRGKFQLGKAANHMSRLPRRYNRSMLKIQDAKGRAINTNKPVRLAGTIQAVRTGKEKKKSCTLLVEHVSQ